VTDIVPSARTLARQNRRERIIIAAVDVLAINGFDGAAIRDIAAASGMVKGNLYHYFPAKQDLLFEIVDDLHERFLERLAVSSARGGGSLERLSAVLFGHCILVCQRSKQTLVTYQNFRYLTEDRRAVIISKRNLYERYVRALVEECKADGLTCPGTAPAEATRAILGMTNWIYEWYSPTGAMAPEKVAQAFSEMALGILRPCEILGHRHDNCDSELKSTHE
jgi:TetR/AcrR family transcriptional regulator, cholesterol catabolism regulator